MTTKNTDKKKGPAAETGPKIKTGESGKVKVDLPVNVRSRLSRLRGKVMFVADAVGCEDCLSDDPGRTGAFFVLDEIASELFDLSDKCLVVVEPPHEETDEARS
jgi:hypothetical protein